MKLEALLGKTLNRNKPISLQALRRQAAKLGLTIQIDRAGGSTGYWIDGTDWEDDRFCSTKEELEWKLKELAKEDDDEIKTEKIIPLDEEGLKSLERALQWPEDLPAYDRLNTPIRSGLTLDTL